MHLAHVAVIVDGYDAAIEVVGEPRDEPYGRVAVLVDVAGNRRDVLGPPAADLGRRRVVATNTRR